MNKEFIEGFTKTAFTVDPKLLGILGVLGGGVGLAYAGNKLIESAQDDLVQRDDTTKKPYLKGALGGAMQTSGAAALPSLFVGGFGGSEALAKFMAANALIGGAYGAGEVALEKQILKGNKKNTFSEQRKKAKK
jgi:hypothetical protein